MGRGWLFLPAVLYGYTAHAFSVSSTATSGLHLQRSLWKPEFPNLFSTVPRTSLPALKKEEHTRFVQSLRGGSPLKMSTTGSEQVEDNLVMYVVVSFRLKTLFCNPNTNSLIPSSAAATVTLIAMAFANTHFTGPQMSLK
jgi:hypothetical protein